MGKYQFSQTFQKVGELFIFLYTFIVSQAVLSDEKYLLEAKQKPIRHVAPRYDP